MAREPLNEYEKDVHKKFIPANIVIAVIALIAMFCQLFMPCIDLRMTLTGESLSQMVLTSFSEEQKNTLGSTLEGTMEDVEFEIPINFYPMKLLKAGTGDLQDVEDFMNSIIGSNGSKALLDDLIDSVAPSLLTTGIASIVSENGAPPEIAKKYKPNAEKVLEQLNAGDEATAKAEFSTIAHSIATEQGKTISNEKIDEYFADFTEAGKNSDGSFDTTTLIKNFDMDMLTGSEQEETPPEGEEGGTETPPTEDTESKENPLAPLLTLMENPGSMMLEMFGDGDSQALLTTLQPTFLVMFFLLAGFPALMWFFLALSAILHIFTQRKRVRMWYVKLFCFYPGFIVLGGNLGMSLLSKNVAGGAGSLLTNSSIKMLGSGIVTGICYVALILLSIFWYGRLSRKAKRVEKGEDFDVE